MQYSQEHLKTMVYAEFGGQTECIMGNSKIENRPVFPVFSSAPVNTRSETRSRRSLGGQYKSLYFVHPSL